VYIVAFPLFLRGVVDNLSVHCCVPAILSRCCGQPACPLLFDLSAVRYVVIHHSWCVRCLINDERREEQR
jgi:hypothetical protein